MNKKRYLYSLPIILLLIVVIVGFVATDYLGNKARQEIISESQASVLTLSTLCILYILQPLKAPLNPCPELPHITLALFCKRDQDIKNANDVLDRYNSAMNTSVAYLMDTNGTTVASSNRNDPDSFLGISYRFRPYFQEAAKGQPYHYFALGITSGKRGFYASYPVHNPPGKVIGVVTIKRILMIWGSFSENTPFAFSSARRALFFCPASRKWFEKVSGRWTKRHKKN